MALQVEQKYQYFAPITLTNENKQIHRLTSGQRRGGSSFDQRAGRQQVRARFAALPNLLEAQMRGRRGRKTRRGTSTYGAAPTDGRLQQTGSGHRLAQRFGGGRRAAPGGAATRARGAGRQQQRVLLEQQLVQRAGLLRRAGRVGGGREQRGRVQGAVGALQRQVRFRVAGDDVERTRGYAAGLEGVLVEGADGGVRQEGRVARVERVGGRGGGQRVAGAVALQDRHVQHAELARQQQVVEVQVVEDVATRIQIGQRRQIRVANKVRLVHLEYVVVLHLIQLHVDAVDGRRPQVVRIDLRVLLVVLDEGRRVPEVDIVILDRVHVQVAATGYRHREVAVFVDRQFLLEDERAVFE